MAITMTLPNDIVTPLKRQADAQPLSVENVVLDILGTALETEDTFPIPETVVAKIKATPPNPQSIRPARDSLAEALRDGPEDPHFNLARWNQEWAGVEAEMKAMTQANDIAEGRE